MRTPDTLTAGPKPWRRRRRSTGTGPRARVDPERPPITPVRAVLRLVLASILLAGCAHGGPEAQPTPRSEPASETSTFGFRAPESLDEVGFRRIAAQRLPLAELGYSLRYDGEERAVVDVYLYPVIPDGEDLTDEVRRTRVQEEFAQALRDIHTLSEREDRTVDDADEPRPLAVEGPTGQTELMHQRVVYGYPDGRSADSHLLVGAAGRVMIKVRSTFPSDDAAERLPQVEAFLDAFARSLEVEGHAGMAEFDAHAARLLPVPDDLPESFAYRIPRGLRSGWQLQGSQRLPDDEGAVAVFASRVTPARIQILLRPWDPAGPDEDPDSAAERFEAAWAEETERWSSQFEAGLGEQGFSPLEDDFEELAPSRLWTHYGPTTTFRARRVFRREDGAVGVTHFAMTTVEEVVLMASSFVGGADADVGEGLFVGFVEELVANFLATRPPLEMPPPPDTPPPPGG